MLTIATDADVPAVVSLISRAFRGRGEDAGWSIKEEYIEGTRITEDLLRDEMAAKPRATVLLWRQADNELLGCIWMEPEENGVWYLGLLAIPPQEQNSGLGRILLRAAEDWAQVRGAAEIEMSVVNLRVRLIEWYKRRGYDLTGQTKPFPYGDNRYGIPKRDDLHLVALRKTLGRPNQDQSA
jgi:ribosomal protein S18 acetylase RimI-like enzyme